MNTRQILIALSASLALLGAASTASASDNDRDGGPSATQAQRDWVEWQRTLGRTPGSASVDNGGSSYGFAAPHASRHQVRREPATAQRRIAVPGYSDYGYAHSTQGGETYIGIQDDFFRRSN